ncbi:hypothetical protein J15TS10_48540 [Paenibacillus woosongensis]|uniref:Uncharacterized protein n=1 Tax=Paenibacillus woosongensis TaxID=307580 RepID=A0ABQ4MYU0_9BACL|nr:hypothetical protein J15TS10_48540 [Paenibacillus woosongensis]
MRVSMAGNDRAVCSEIIDIAVAVYVPEMGASRFIHKNGRPAPNRFERAGGAVDAADNMLESFFV